MKQVGKWNKLLQNNSINSQNTEQEKTQNTHTQPFNGLLSCTTRVGRYQKKHSPTHTYPDHQTSFINFLHLLYNDPLTAFDQGQPG